MSERNYKLAMSALIILFIITLINTVSMYCDLGHNGPESVRSMVILIASFAFPAMLLSAWVDDCIFWDR